MLLEISSIFLGLIGGLVDLTYVSVVLFDTRIASLLAIRFYIYREDMRTALSHVAFPIFSSQVCAEPFLVFIFADIMAA